MIESQGRLRSLTDSRGWRFRSFVCECLRAVAKVKVVRTFVKNKTQLSKRSGAIRQCW